MIKIVVADDHAVVRTGLQLMFQVKGNIQMAGEVPNGIELMRYLRANVVDVAIVDLNMPGRDSIDLISEIHQQFPGVSLVVFTMNKDENLMKRLLKAGVMAFINKEENPEIIIEAIYSAAKKKPYLTAAQKEMFAGMYLQEENNDLLHTRLTDREYQVMCLLASGVPKDEIAKKLMISKNTLSNHRNNILKKMNLSSTVDLTRYAINHQLIQ
ncbi:MAG: response regulator transcription factor [Bacteroidales bacterium]|nr:response regulator transcription factor [Bacteroidales bacterium]